MSNKAWFPFYVGDYLSGTLTFTTEEHGAYILLLLHYWSNQGPITSDPRELKNICKLSKHKFSKSCALILKKFSLQNGKYFHVRMDREIAKAVELSNKRAAAGKAGGEANAQANDKQLPTQSQSQSHKDTTTRGTRLAEGWQPNPELLAWATTERPDLDITNTINSFCDYWQSKAGKDGVKIKWDLVFRNWVRNERNRHGTNRQASNGTGKQTLSERHAAARESAVNDYLEAESLGSEVVGSDG